ncbi:MAG TPA: radical SAM protein [Thermodesulfobacteriota bacterium]|nr:radical SAM protein [Thermodesulfobacteriota bacterium]
MRIIRDLAYARVVAGILHGSRSFGGPLQANISLTNRCNLRCIHCYAYSPCHDGPSFFDTRTNQGAHQYSNDSCKESADRVDADLFKTNSLIEKLLSMGTQEFLFSGNGEPFLHKNILDFIERVKGAGRTCLVNTNGTLLDHATIDRLIMVRFDELRITTMAGTRELYEITHPGVSSATFDRLRDNLLYLAEHKKVLGTGKPVVTLVSVVISKNCEALMEFSRFAHGVHAKRVLFRPFDDYNSGDFAKLVPTAEQADSVQKQLMAIADYFDSRKIVHNIENFLKVFRKKLDTTDLYRRIPCYYGWLSARIEVDGAVYPCCRCYVALGNIYEKEFPNIWKGPAYRRFRKTALHINKNKTPVDGCYCNTCVHHTANLRVHGILHPFERRY